MLNLKTKGSIPIRHESTPRLALASAAVLAAGLLASAAIILWFDEPTLDVSDSVIVAVICLEIFTHMLPRRLLAFGGSVESITLDEVLFVPMLLVLDPTQLAGTAAAASLAGSLVVRRTPVKSVFNCGQYVGSCALGYLAYHLRSRRGSPSRR
jgi:hypothetical protein